MTQRMTYSNYKSLKRNSVDEKKIDLDRNFAAKAIFLILLQIPLALLFQRNSIFATIHAFASLGLGLIWLFHDQSPKRVTLMVAYITGSELLWRGTHAGVFYEFGKYAVILLLILAILKFRLLKNTTNWPVFYFVLLTPSILVLPYFDREAIAFNLAGPFALAVASMYFRTQTITFDQLRRLFVAILAPIVGLGSMVAFNIISAETLYFGYSSNFQTAAGIGPNQVSSILGLGALVAFLLVIVLNNRFTFLRIFLLGVSLWLFAQTMLTFARGGFWTALASLAAGGMFLIRNTRSRAAFIISALIIFLVGYFYLLPTLDTFTGNTLHARLQSFETTGRIEIAQADWIIFQNNPIFGVGPGQSNLLHMLTYFKSNAHTEYTRMLSEHGVFGLVSLIILLGASASTFGMQKDNWQKAMTIPFMIWTLLFQAHSATRLVAVSFCFGFAFSNLVEKAVNLTQD